jgi:hypothetical protein
LRGAKILAEPRSVILSGAKDLDATLTCGAAAEILRCAQNDTVWLRPQAALRDYEEGAQSGRAAVTATTRALKSSTQLPVSQ